MKISRNSGHEKNGIVLTLITLLVFLVVMPPGLNGTAQSDEGYSSIQSILDSTADPKIAYLYSWDDRLNNPIYDFVTFSDDELFSAASYGEQSFIDYLAQNRFTHILVPKPSSVNGEIFHKWGKRGTVRIALISPYFERVASTNGGDDVVLYKIDYSRSFHKNKKNISYHIAWMESIRKSFYTVNEVLQERGFHAYEHFANYEDGTSVSWVLQYSGHHPEVPAFQIRSVEKSFKFLVSVSLVAAYGPNALPQVIQMTVAGRHVVAKQLQAGIGINLSVEVHSDEVVEFRNVLPCHLPRDFEPADQDSRRFCFGISDISVVPVQN